MFRRSAIAGAILLVASLAGAGFAGAAASRSSAETLRGAGATFPAPLISRWIPAFEKASGINVNYNPIGSGGGIAAITNRQVDFGASDAPLTPDQFRDCKGCVQIPWVLSATSVAYRLEGLPAHLRISGRVLADIYLGKITKWNDRRLAKLNPGVKLPGEKITPIFRSDSSGTTYNFTDYLSSVSPEWKRKVGRATQVNFPAGVGGRGSSGVSGVLARTPGGIIYVDVAYSLKNHFQFFRVQNRAGKFQLPGLRGIAAAASTIKEVPVSNEMHIVNPPKSNPLAYPICTFSYVLLPLKASKATELKRFVNWALTTGQTMGAPLLFQRLPTVVVRKSKKTLTRVRA